LGPALVGGYVWIFAPALAVWKFVWGFPGVPLVSLGVSLVGVQHLVERKEKENMQAAKSSSHQLRKKGHLGRKATSPEEKKAVSEDQEGCGQTSQ